MQLVASTARGLEEVLGREIRALGGASIREEPASVAFEGDLDLLYRAHLWLRTANRVLVPLGGFEARTAEELYAGAKGLPWRDHLDVRRTFAVHATTRDSELRHSNFIALKTKDAVADAFRAAQGARPDVDRADPDVHILVRIVANRVEVALDASGESLHRRGYRKDPSEAPLKETLAAGLVLLSGWRPDEVLLDPLCGAGTILTEAALLGLNRAPGLGRRFGFMRWPGFEPGRWKRAESEAAAERLDRPLRLFGSDVSGEAVARARRNASAAGLGSLLRWSVCDVRDAVPPGPSGVLLTNPPYGERMGRGEDVTLLYRTLGDALKRRYAGWRAYLFTGRPALAKAVGLRSKRRWILWNGPLEGRLIEYPLYVGSAPPPTRSPFG